MKILSKMYLTKSISLWWIFLELKRERGATDTSCPTFLCCSRTTTNTTTGFLLNDCVLPFNNITS